MTREHKLALVVGFGLLLFVGILITDHMEANRRGLGMLQDPAAAVLPRSTPDGLFQREFLEQGGIDQPARARTLALTEPEIVLVPEKKGPADVLGRPAEPEPRPRSREVRPDRTHVVGKGDTLALIAKRHYGDAGLWRWLAEMNGITNAARIKPGQVIRLPERGSRPDVRLRVREVMPVPAPTQKYVVRSGDSVARIARRELGRESRWREITEINPSLDSRNPVIQPGQELVLPAR